MTTLHVTSVYDVPEMNRNDLHKHCDQLMDVLIQLEQVDRTARDATVSIDVVQHRIEIDLEADGATFEQATVTAHHRASTAVAELTVPLTVRELHAEVVEG